VQGYEELVHAKALEILQCTGLRVHDSGVLRRLGSLGARVDQGTLTVRFDRGLIEEALLAIPRDTVLYDWDGNPISGLGTRFMSSGTGMAVLDNSTGLRRPSNRRDVREMVFIQEHMDNLTIVGGLVSASEFGRYRILVECYETLCHSSKHAGLDGQSPQEVDAIVAMGARLAGGAGRLRSNPPFHIALCPKSPLSFSQENIVVALHAAKHGLPVGIMSMSMGGGTAPVPLFGQVLLTVAEVLGGFTIIQMLYPGTPVLACSVASVLDMRTAVLCLGAPERPVLGKAFGAMARHYGVPSIVGGLSSDAKSLDAQDGFEKALTALPLVGHVDFIFGAGNLDSAGTYSAEQLLFDNDLMGAVLAASRNLDTRDAGEVTALIKSIGFAGEYLLSENTLRNFRDYWRPSFFERANYSTWLQDPKTVRVRVRERLDSLLDAPIAPKIDQSSLDDLTLIVRELVGTDFSYDGLPGASQPQCSGKETR
jgi:trimethylamine--corrinoid protein Co-methyltransferase